MFSPKNPKNIFKVKLRKNFEKLFLHNSKTDKDILKISTDSSSAEQQLKNVKVFENSLINKKVAFILKTLRQILKLKYLSKFPLIPFLRTPNLTESQIFIKIPPKKFAGC